MEKYLVGGAVRDLLLGLEVKDQDWVVVGATKEEMLAAGYRQVGKDFPVFLHEITNEEYALARTERKIDKGYCGFECVFDPTVTLEEDLARRDLTINAIAQTESGELIDPFGGKHDLENKILRHVSPAFVEDPLRVLRVARFAARYAHLGFTIHDSTIKLMQAIAKSGELETIVAERVWRETEKALAQSNIRVFIETLRGCYALAVLFPQLNKLWGIPQTEIYHPEIDTGIHVMLALDMVEKLTPDPVIKFAVLFHDLGKGETPVEMLPHHRGHEERGLKPIGEWVEQYKVPKKYAELALLVSKWHLHIHKAFELKPSTIVRMFAAMDAYRRPERFNDFLIACEADARGRLGKEHNSYAQANYLREALAIAQQITSRDFVAQGFAGEELGEQIRLARINAVAKFKSSSTNSQA